MFNDVNSVYVTKSKKDLASYLDFVRNKNKYDYMPSNVQVIGQNREVIILDTTLEKGNIFEITYFGNVNGT